MRGTAGEKIRWWRGVAVVLNRWWRGVAVASGALRYEKNTRREDDILGAETDKFLHCPVKQTLGKPVESNSGTCFLLVF